MSFFKKFLNMNSNPTDNELVEVIKQDNSKKIEKYYLNN